MWSGEPPCEQPRYLMCPLAALCALPSRCCVPIVQRERQVRQEETSQRGRVSPDGPSRGGAFSGVSARVPSGSTPANPFGIVSRDDVIFCHKFAALQLSLLLFAWTDQNDRTKPVQNKTGRNTGTACFPPPSRTCSKQAIAPSAGSRRRLVACCTYSTIAEGTVAEKESRAGEPASRLRA